MWEYKIGVQEYISTEAKENNAIEFYNFFKELGATDEAICGMLGNVQRESQLNPGIKQNATTSSGWGLIQWTPYSILTDWCNKYNYTWYDGAAQCERIRCEGTGEKGASGYFFPSKSHPEYSYTWSEFLALTDVHTAVYAYLYERERAGVEAIDERLAYADAWYEYFTGTPIPPTPPTPPVPPPPIKPRIGMPFYMMLMPPFY